MIISLLSKYSFQIGIFLKITFSLYIIGTSLYDILEDINLLIKEHGLLLIGVLGFCKALWELYEKSHAINKAIKKYQQKRIKSA